MMHHIRHVVFEFWQRPENGDLKDGGTSEDGCGLFLVSLMFFWVRFNSA